jgi:hypothetical protein
MDGRATLRVVQALESWAELEAGENEARRELEAKTRSPRRASTSYYRNRSRNVLASPPAQFEAIVRAEVLDQPQARATR